MGAGTESGPVMPVCLLIIDLDGKVYFGRFYIFLGSRVSLVEELNITGHEQLTSHSYVLSNTQHLLDPWLSAWLGKYAQSVEAVGWVYECDW